MTRATRVLIMARPWAAALAVGLALGVARPAPAAEWFVSPQGTTDPAAGGTRTNPWDLQTALSHPSKVQPGDVIWVRGGRHLGAFQSGLLGSPTAPIVVRGYPGERATIDSGVETTLASAIPAGVPLQEDPQGCNIQVVDGRLIRPGSFVFIDQERVYLAAKADANTFRGCTRGYGTASVAHPAGARVRLQASPLLVGAGGHVHFRDMEVTSSSLVRSIPLGHAGPAGIDFFVPGVKAINLVVHDNSGNGIGFWMPATDAELYGNLIFNNGWQFDNWAGGNGDRGHGHGIYSQNDVGRKAIRDNLVFNQFALGIQIYGSSPSARAKNYLVEGNVIFGNGAPSLPDWGDWAPILAGGTPPLDDLKVIDNRTYGPGARAGVTVLSGAFTTYGEAHVQNDPSAPDTTANRGLVMTGNYFAGPRGSLVGAFLDVVVWGNTVVFDGNPESVGLTYQIPQHFTPDPGSYLIADNSYFDRGRTREGEAVQGLPPGLERGATFVHTAPGVPPDAVFYHSQDPQYSTAIRLADGAVREVPGRTTIVVYNWSKAPAVTVDLSRTALLDGQGFEVRDVQDFYRSPVAAGTYGPALRTLDLSMAPRSVPPPVGGSLVPLVHTAPEFAAFVVLPTAAGTVPADVQAPVVTITQPTNAPSYAASSAGLSLAGAASDDVGVTQVVWSSDRAGSGTATGTSSWSISGIALLPGTTNFTVTARDASGKTGSDTLAVTYSPPPSPSPAGKVVFFDAARSQYAQLPSRSFADSDFAVEVWVKVPSCADAWILGNGEGSDLRCLSGKAFFQYYYAGGGSLTSATTIADDRWHHLAAVQWRDGQVNRLKLYVDGREEASGTLSGTGLRNPGFQTAGQRGTGRGFLTGSICSLHVYRRALSAPASYLAGRPCTAPADTTGLVGAWRFTEGSGASVPDASGQSGPATLVNGPAWVPLDVPPPADVQAPVVTITQPTNAPSYGASSGSLSLAGAASDDVGVTQVVWSSDRAGSGTASGTSSWSISGITLPAGTTNFIVTARDASGKTGSDTLAVTYSAPPAGKVVFFDAARSQYAQLPSRSFADSDFAVEVWIRVSSCTDAWILGNGEGSDLRCLSGKAFFQYYYAGGGSLTSATAIADDRWHHVAATQGKDAQGSHFLRLYVDGRLEAITSLSGGGSRNPGFQTVGQRGTGRGYLTGSVCEVHVYNKVLALPSYVAGSPCTTARDTVGLVGAWKFTEGSGTTVNDYSGQSGAAQLVNQPSWVP